VITPAGSVYWSAHALDGDRLVVARADSDSSGAAAKFGLYVFNLQSRKVEQTLYRSPKFSGVEAVPMEKRPAPLYYWSILHPDRDYGRVVCLNSYLSADAPRGRLAGHIAKVRVIALEPDHHTERSLGDAPVESDGSFYLKVPADQPIRFELLSTKGEVIHEQKSWIWARTGEDVPCLGCHESKALVPEDRWPLALKHSDAPIPVGLPSKPQAARH
jgi:Hydrazine synthase alpha subunit middle domain